MQNSEIILKQFPGTTMIPMVIAGNCIGLARQTSYNLFHKKEFPIPVRKVGRKSMVALKDLINFMDREPGAPVIVVQEELPKKKSGRPTKGEQVRRQREAALA